MGGLRKDKMGGRAEWAGRARPASGDRPGARRWQGSGPWRLADGGQRLVPPDEPHELGVQRRVERLRLV
ncbi:MAG TPA: hypothetical protein VIR16_00790, partial [Candidatus Limnocylindrales bacterium]